MLYRWRGRGAWSVRRTVPVQVGEGEAAGVRGRRAAGEAQARHHEAQVPGREGRRQGDQWRELIKLPKLSVRSYVGSSNSNLL